MPVVVRLIRVSITLVVLLSLVDNETVVPDLLMTALSWRHVVTHPFGYGNDMPAVFCLVRGSLPLVVLLPLDDDTIVPGLLVSTLPRCNAVKVCLLSEASWERPAVGGLFAAEFCLQASW